MWEGSWLRLGSHEYWETKLLSDWHYPLLWIVEVPEPQLDRPESVVEKRVKEQHMHPVQMSPELRYEYLGALARRPGESEQDPVAWIQQLQAAMCDWAKSQGMLIKRQVMPRNPHGGIEDRCLTGVNRDRVAQVGQLRVTVDELREELATRLGMLRKGDQELRAAMAVAAGRAKKAAKQRKQQEARA